MKKFKEPNKKYVHKNLDQFRISEYKTNIQDRKDVIKKLEEYYRKERIFF